jgi:hypothetical protein
MNEIGSPTEVRQPTKFCPSVLIVEIISVKKTRPKRAFDATVKTFLEELKINKRVVKFMDTTDRCRQVFRSESERRGIIDHTVV